MFRISFGKLICIFHPILSVKRTCIRNGFVIRRFRVSIIPSMEIWFALSIMQDTIYRALYQMNTRTSMFVIIFLIEGCLCIDSCFTLSDSVGVCWSISFHLGYKRPKLSAVALFTEHNAHAQTGSCKECRQIRGCRERHQKLTDNRERIPQREMSFTRGLELNSLIKYCISFVSH